MNIVLIGAMMAVMLLFFHGRGHHEPSPAPGHHATEEREPPASTVDGDKTKPPSQPVRDSDPKSERGTEQTMPLPKAD